MSDDPFDDLPEEVDAFIHALQGAYLDMAFALARAVAMAGGELLLPNNTRLPAGERHLVTSYRCLHEDSDVDADHDECGQVIALHPGSVDRCASCLAGPSPSAIHRGQARPPRADPFDLSWMRPGSKDLN